MFFLPGYKVDKVYVEENMAVTIYVYNVSSSTPYRFTIHRGHYIYKVKNCLNEDEIDVFLILGQVFYCDSMGKFIFVYLNEKSNKPVIHLLENETEISFFREQGHNHKKAGGPDTLKALAAFFG